MKITTVYLTDDQKLKLTEISKNRGGQKIAELIRMAIDLLVEKFGKEGK